MREVRSSVIIENDFESALLLTEYLSDTCLKIIHLSNAEWLKLPSHDPVSLIIKGITLKEMSNGLQLLKKIRQIYPGTPIIAYSASVFSHEIKACYEAGCNDFIGKPVDLDLLNDMLNRYMY